MNAGVTTARGAPPAALVFDSGSAAKVAGLTLTERAILLAGRLGLAPINVSGERALSADEAERLGRRGVTVVRQPTDLGPLEQSGNDQGIVVIGPDALFGPEALAALTAQTSDATGVATAARDSSGAPLLLYLPSRVVGDMRACRSIEMMAERLAAQGSLRVLAPAGIFCQRVNGMREIASVERAYIRHLTGMGESYFTKKIRRFSVPLTRHLLRLGFSPAQVTMSGLALAVVSAWSMSQGTYVTGLVGAVLYYMSMVFDCCDGEVARSTMRDDPFGAWLETMVDYLTYFMMLAALTMASQSRPGAEIHRIAAGVALVGSLIVALVAGYLRQRVAGADPGQFDEASARVLASASPIHRFARWGRQWIKRSSLAHLVVVLALVNQLPALLLLWAFGATVASVTILAVEPFVARRVRVSPAGIRDVDAAG